MKESSLIYGNVWSKVNITSESLFRKIDMAFSFQKRVYNPLKKKKETKTVHLLRKTRKPNWYYFPSGLFNVLAPYPKVHEDLLVDAPFEEGKIYQQLRDYQKEYLHKLLEVPRGIVELTTGGGKTVIMAAIIERIKPDQHILIIIPKSTSLLEQTVERMISYFGEDEVGWNYGGGFKDGRIMITSPGCAEKLSLNGYSVLLFDEVHLSSAKKTKSLLLKIQNAKMRYGFSGTPTGRSDENDMWTIGLFGDIIKVVSYEDLKEEGYVADCEYIQIFFDSSDLLDLPYVGKYNDWKAIVDHFFLNNNTRNEIVVRVVNKAIQKGRKVLVITDRIEHGRQLEKEIAGSKFVYSNTKNVQKYVSDLNSGKLNVLIATSLIDTGIDIPELDTIVLASIGKSKIQLLQRVGRALRPKDGKVKIIDLVDTGSGLLYKHASDRRDYVLDDAGFSYVSAYIRNIKDLERL